MKTPRELFLERHRDAVMTLEAISPDLLASHAREAIRQNDNGTSVTLAAHIWNEMFGRWKRTWLGVGAAWVIIFAVDATQSEPQQQAVGRMTAVPASDILQGLHEQRRMLAQLLGPIDQPLPAQMPKIEGPRSELKSVIGMA
jgi:hypothetical protein